LQEQEGGTVPKDWVYTQYVAFCKKHGLRIKENAVFAKMFYQLFPNVTSRRIGSGRGIRSCYLGVTALKETDGPQIKKQEEEQAEGDLLFDSKTHANATNTGQPIKQERHEEGGGPRPKKRKRGRMFGLNAARKERSRRGTECHVEGGGGEGLLAEHISKADRHLSQLIRLHQCLVGGKSDYDPDVERWVRR